MSGKVEVVNVATGEALTRFSVDARELVASGEFVYAADYVAPADAPADTPARKGKA